MIEDSGNRRAFESGAVRDISEGKGRCDLLPLGVIGERLNNEILKQINDYLYTNDYSHLYAALDCFIGKDKKKWYSAMLEVSKHYEEGAKKYNDRNWEQGIDLHYYIDSGVRHYLKYLRGDKDEPHDRAFIWNILGAIWTHINLPNLNDNPGGNK